MIPAWWAAVVMGLAGFRIARILGWDDFPPVFRARRWATGEIVRQSGSGNAHAGLTNEPLEVTYEYRRPLLAHFLHCAYCTGFWIALAEYGGWLLDAKWTLRVLFPFALAAVPGLLARNLDP